MSFSNDYLTNEEKEIFKQRAIPTGVFWKGGILGYNPYSKVRCTLDRDKHIYLFYLGKYHDAEDLDEDNFALVWDSLSGNEAIQITIKMDFLHKSVHGEDGVLWHSLSLGLPQNLKSEKATIIEKLKEAFNSYGVNGTPGLEGKYNTKFDFETPKHQKENQVDLETLTTRIENEDEHYQKSLWDNIAEPQFTIEETKIMRQNDISDKKELCNNKAYSGRCEKGSRIVDLLKGGRLLFDYMRILFVKSELHYRFSDC